MIDLRSLLHRFETTPEQLADRAKLSHERVRQLLEGGEASLAELRSIASALNVNLSDLVPQGSRYQKVNLMFRRQVPKGKPIDEVAIDRLSKKIENTFGILGELEGGLAWIEQFVVETESYEVAESCAEKFRHVFYGGDLVSPLLRLPEIIVRDLDVLLFVVNLPHIDGASAYIDGQPFIFVSSRFPPRMLFTLAHEMGHLIAHKGDPHGFATLDWLTEDDGSSEDRKLAEAFANAFASCLLLPASGVGVALRKIREIAQLEEDQMGDIELLYLSRIFGTSFEVAARRCEDLKLLPRGGARSLYEEISKRFGSPEKRAALLKLPPRPDVYFPVLPERLLTLAIEKINSGAVSLGRASAVLGISISDILAAHAPVKH